MNFQNSFIAMKKLQSIHNNPAMCHFFSPAVTFFLWLLLLLIFGRGALDSNGSLGGRGCWSRGCGKCGLGTAFKNVITWWHGHVRNYRRGTGEKIRTKKCLNNGSRVNMCKMQTVFADIYSPLRYHVSQMSEI